MALHAFTDESKEQGFILVTVLVDEHELGQMRSGIRAWRAKGAKRFHTSKERPERRDTAMADLAKRDIAGIVVAECQESVKGYVARGHVLEATARAIAMLDVARWVIEADETAVANDKGLLSQLSREGLEPSRDYVHMRAHEEPILWAADLIAWHWARGGAHRNRAQKLAVEAFCA